MFFVEIRYRFIDDDDFVFIIWIEEFYFLNVSFIVDVVDIINNRNRRVLRINEIKKINVYFDYNFLNHNLKNVKLLLIKIKILIIIDHDLIDWDKNRIREMIDLLTNIDLFVVKMKRTLLIIVDVNDKLDVKYKYQECSKHKKIWSRKRTFVDEVEKWIWKWIWSSDDKSENKLSI